MTPVWPTMSGLAKLMIPKRKSSSSHARDERARRPRARSSRACGRRSGRRAGEGTSSRRSPSSGLLLAAAEEVRHVRVLLGLGDVQLAAAALRR